VVAISETETGYRDMHNMWMGLQGRGRKKKFVNGKAREGVCRVDRTCVSVCLVRASVQVCTEVSGVGVQERITFVRVCALCMPQCRCIPKWQCSTAHA